jgi:cytochrome c-type biogenesis protein CcmH/NrfG
MYKVKIILLALIAMSFCTCRTVQKTESKKSDQTSLDSNNTTLKRSLNELSTNNTHAEVTSYEFEYVPATPEEKAKGDSTPKPRIKKVTKAVYDNGKTTAKTDNTAVQQTTVNKQEVKKQDDTQVIKKAGFPFWILIPIAIAVGLVLYWKYGNLGALLIKIFKIK